MSKKKKKETQQSNIFYASRDKLCEYTLSLRAEDWKYCKAPPSTQDGTAYSIVYNTTHMDRKSYECGCIIYTNQYYPEYKFPELIWKDFFYEEISPGEKLVKFTVRKCASK